jgi:hypothetical protein
MGWDYVVRATPDLDRLRVRICFRGFLPRRLVLSRGLDPSFLSLPAREGAAPRLARDPQGNGFVPVGLQNGGCVDYEVATEVLLRVRSPVGRTQPIGGGLAMWPGLFLLRPVRWPPAARVTLAFDLPPGMHCAVPWQRESTSTPADRSSRFRVHARTLEVESTLAIGAFATHTVAARGGTIDVAVFDAPHEATGEGIRRWIGAAAAAVGDFFGRYPVPRAQVFVHPMGSRGEPVLFGRSLRGAGPQVTLLLKASATDEQLLGEWVAVHEMLHLGMPWTPDEDSWIQEGFVMYYTEVLRARAGFQTAQEGWQRLHEGFSRGIRGGGRRTLAEESRLMHRNRAYMRVYWGGAAIALLIDLELRRLWPGRRSLDDVMRYWEQQFANAGGPWSGRDLVKMADDWLGRPVCLPIADRWLPRREFPALEDAYAGLGLEVVDGRIVFREGAPQARERRAIMTAGGR